MAPLKKSDKFSIFAVVSIVVFLIYHIVISGFFPTDETNHLIAPDWYFPVGLLSSGIVTLLLFIAFNKLSKIIGDRRARPHNYRPIITSPTPVYQMPNAQQIEAMQMLLKQAKESAEIVNTTKSPSVFFGRLNFLFDVLLELQAYEKYGLFRNSSPTNDYNNLSRNLEKTVDNFLDRADQSNVNKIRSLKTLSAKKRNRQKFVTELLNAFSSAKLFWRGNSIYPHYTGPLYTSSNYDHVDRIAKAQVDQLISTPVVNIVNNKSSLSFVEKELAIVNMTTDAHMQQLIGFPFVWNQKIQKSIRPHSHPFCYMNIVGSNISAIQNELTNLNLQIISDCRKNGIHVSLFIPVTDLVFTEQDHQGHTKFLCTPITIDGELSDYPLTVFFTTPDYYYTSGSSIPVRATNTTHGEVTYGIDGTMKKAKVYFWRECKHWFFHYNTINGLFCLTKIEKSPSG